MDLKIQAMLRKGAIRLVEKSQNQFLSPIFLVEKKDVGYNSVMNLKKVKSKDSLHSFQNGGSLAFKGVSLERRFFMQTRFKGCRFFSCNSQNIPEISKISKAVEDGGRFHLTAK